MRASAFNYRVYHLSFIFEVIQIADAQRISGHDGYAADFKLFIGGNSRDVKEAGFTLLN